MPGVRPSNCYIHLEAGGKCELVGFGDRGGVMRGREGRERDRRGADMEWVVGGRGGCGRLGEDGVGERGRVRGGE